MNRRLTLIVTLLFATMVTWADDFNLYYDASSASSHVKIAAVADIQKLVFEDGQMTVVTTGGATTSLPVANIHRLFFSTDSTVAIDEVKEQQEQTPQETVIYDLMGRRVMAAPDQLAKGIYIINGKKVSVK